MIVCCICSYIAFSIVFAVRCVKHCLLFEEIPFGIIRKKDIKFFDATFLLRKVVKCVLGHFSAFGFSLSNSGNSSPPSALPSITIATNRSAYGEKTRALNR